MHSLRRQGDQGVPGQDGLTPRVAWLRQNVLERPLPTELPPLRGELATAVLQETLSRPQSLRMAGILDSVLRNIPTPVGPRELLVGRRTADGYPELDQAIARGSAEHPYMIVDFETVLREGMSGVIRRAEARLAQLDEAAPEQMQGVHFLQAAIHSCQAVMAWAERYAVEAERQAAAEADPVRQRELTEIAARCCRVPTMPACSFADALQSVWFLYVALYIETPAASCLGRVDQYLRPYYEHDLAEDVLTRAEAKEWLCCLWVKLYENVLGVMGSHAQTITLGGLLPDGASGVNDLSFLCLETAAAMGNVGAQIAVRWHEGQDPKLLAAAFALIRRGAIMPQMFNDHVYIAALRNLGVPDAEARRFALFGCHEPVIAGLGYQRPASWPGYVSFYDWLEHALGLESHGTPPELRRIADPPANAAELWDRWLAAMREGIRRAVIACNHGDVIKREFYPRPLMSAFLGDCLARAADMTAGGARYNMTGFQGCALATAVDAFMAVQKRVFEQHTATMPELVAALRENWQGAEPLRQSLFAQPEVYGAGSEEANELARRMVAAFCTEVLRHRNMRGGRFAPGMWSFIQNVLIGKRTAASPDGRHAGDPVSHSMDPVSGHAAQGPTAVMQAAARLDQKQFANGGSLLVEFDGATMADPAGAAATQHLCETYFRMGGIELQLSAASPELLRAAQETPDRYADLSVRIAGYSDFFVRQSPDLQDYIIGREKHRVTAG